MNVSNAQRQGDKLLNIFSDIRLQEWDLDHMAQHFIHNAYPLIDVTDKVLTFTDFVKYHYDQAGVCNGQQQLF